VIFRIGFESDVGITISAFKIKSEDFNTEIDLIIADFHSHVELSSDVKIVGTSIAPETHWQHVSDDHEFVLTSAPFYDFFMVKVFREILVQNFSFCHFSKIYYYKLKNYHINF